MKTSYVLGFMFSATNENKVILIEKLKPSWQCGLLNGIGGKIEAGESPVQAMVREFQEEAGLETTSQEWTPFGVIKGVAFNGGLFEVHLFKSKGNLKQCFQKTAERLVVCDVLDPSLPGRAVENVMSLLHCCKIPEKTFLTLEYGPNSVPQENTPAVPREVGRMADSSSQGFLRVGVNPENGDVYVCTFGGTTSSRIDFKTPLDLKSDSPHTKAALLELMQAIHKDNKEFPDKNFFRNV